ncbi:hypothetical protein [Streptomyces olivaceus]|uniref:hypothetical protein n=1 Tax=Streptomyces olivaceus TaxID=47716 RepID=UPI0036654AA2
MSFTTDYRAERRADDEARAERERVARASEAEQRRLDAAAAEERRAERTRQADERAARLREQQRSDREAESAAKAARRRERAARRAEALTPERIYRTGTLALVVASGLASLPAQVRHFGAISPALLPLPFALEGAAWVMAAGVAYADARSAPGWVRWLLRFLVAACAGFAAYINYGYGKHLAGLSPADANAAAWGLAAVTLLGPVVFEIRQWVSTLAGRDEEARARRKHATARRRDHRQVNAVARRLISATPYGDLPAEDAWTRAWRIIHGPTDPGMTARLERAAVVSAARLADARSPQQEGRIRKGRRSLLAASADTVPALLSASADDATTPRRHDATIQAESSGYPTETDADQADNSETVRPELKAVRTTKQRAKSLAADVRDMVANGVDDVRVITDALATRHGRDAEDPKFKATVGRTFRTARAAQADDTADTHQNTGQYL